MGREGGEGDGSWRVSYKTGLFPGVVQASRAPESAAWRFRPRFPGGLVCFEEETLGCRIMSESVVNLVGNPPEEFTSET